MEDKHKRFYKLMEMINEVSERISSAHSMPLEYGTGVSLYRSEIHTMQEIGEKPGINVTELADAMGLTKGAVSQTLRKLVKKGLVVKKQAPDNAKEVHLELTDRGLIGFNSHQEFHMQMYQIASEYFGDRFEENIGKFIDVITDLKAILEISEKGIKT